jgi:hypothetical protein
MANVGQPTVNNNAASEFYINSQKICSSLIFNKTLLLMRILVEEVYQMLFDFDYVHPRRSQ